MALQKQVNLYPDVAIEGALYRSPIEVTAGITTAITTVARAVFSSVTAAGVLADAVSNVKGAAGILAGIAYKGDLAVNTDINSEATMAISSGSTIQILTKGSVWVKNTVAVAAMGQNVFVKDTDGTITTQAGIVPLAGYTATSFIVIGLKASGAVSDLILVSNTQA